MYFVLSAQGTNNFSCIKLYLISQRFLDPDIDVNQNNRTKGRNVQMLIQTSCRFENFQDILESLASRIKNQQWSLHRK